jgi:hypothetical protein
VYSFFKVSCDIYVLVCASLDLFRYCVVMCGFLVDSFCAILYLCTYGLVCYSIGTGTGLGHLYP